jgi:hypothetical protein
MFDLSDARDVNLDTPGVLARGVVEDAGFATDDLLVDEGR